MTRYEYSESDMKKAGYNIYNCVIEGADFVISDSINDMLNVRFVLKLRRGGKFCNTITLTSDSFGKYCMKEEYIGDKYHSLCFADIMDIAGVKHFEDLVGSYVRIATNGGITVVDDVINYVTAIGNIIDDNWVDAMTMRVEVK